MKRKNTAKPEITVFIMNYNGLKFVERCLKAIDAQTKRHRTVFLDNHSTDGSYEKVDGFRKNGKYIDVVVQNRKNMYIAFMQQQAMGMCKTKYAAFCHIDCIPEKRWLEKLYHVAEKERAGAVEPEIIHPNNQVLHGTLTRWFTPKLTGKCERYPLSVCTAATLYRNLGLKLFDPTFKHYHDENYSSEVLKRSGWGLVHIGDCVVRHEGSHSGLMTLKWKIFARFNQARIILKFRRPAKNPAAYKPQGL